MRFTSDTPAGHTIRSYESGQIILSDRQLSAPAILSAERIIDDWSPPASGQLSLADLEPALALQPEIILLGTGSQQRFPDIHLLTAVMRLGIAIEVMQTAAACRTFNVLIGEKRAVVALLLADPAGSPG